MNEPDPVPSNRKGDEPPTLTAEDEKLLDAEWAKMQNGAYKLRKPAKKSENS